jgi:hypothetical protein
VTADRTAATAEEFAARVAPFDAAPAVEESAVERVARAMFDADDWPPDYWDNRVHGGLCDRFPAIYDHAYRRGVAQADPGTMPKRESCRACRDELPSGSRLPLADFIIWGKLAGQENLGPRCAAHAEKALGWNFASQVDQWAVYDLRPINRAALDADS